MYTVLLVDDEKWVLSGIQMTFPWDRYGFEVIAATTKSKEAWEIIKEKKPDVVFSDVRMPNISGLELVSKVRESKIDCEFIIISGFSEFEYAQAALRNAVFDYCLKPIKEEDAERTLKRLKEFLDNKFNAKSTTSPESEPIYDSDISNVEFNNILLYINENYDKKFQLNELAKEFFINPNYCCYLFKKHFNMSYSEYVAQIRMKKASELLEKDTMLSTNAISKLVGYDDYYYFNKVFKKHFGVTTMQYRKKILSLGGNK